MAELYPTKTRLALLRAMKNGEVYRRYDGVDIWGGLKVNARVAELVRADLARFGSEDSHWWPTVAGEAVLAASKESAS